MEHSPPAPCYTYVLPLDTMPRVTWEACRITPDNPRPINFKLRGTDGPLFHAYYNVFVKTYGHAISIWNGPTQLSSGEYVVNGSVSIETYEEWTGTPSRFRAPQDAQPLNR